MRLGMIGIVGAALLLAACGKGGAPATEAGANDEAGMMVSNEVLMSDDMGAANMTDMGNAGAENVAR